MIHVISKVLIPPRQKIQDFEDWDDEELDEEDFKASDGSIGFGNTRVGMLAILFIMVYKDLCFVTLT